ncbi:hypothetical protein A3D78_05240 [Candidatus Gottesmanbacteria bacterium RIFCSPHIGHO2_02_FULL_39_14]|uniref:Glycosyltransferase RgtA/B/C/D-like domain-containing protein n=3 Tax=Candidatus Gottesmaniibacteriota TaxID=1752720 RepID=A0A1F5ZYT6_9BACT|nr:MAG: hypothetical protein A2153_02965 [Candidatus Gottesmanbacteria bacterium RBG_16_38_7b]OGG17629.1 MAG: hypothetical protein A3D78_05240 [Candidatus Gottesmanbacteria bacterium RIFCSPHIGHO2_02_FULL_39_14]OGG32021.1 MAG: hypothetical protein A3I51_01755 [Candidatus Gottesmanbacteria bacterium RIFCSPLOWO2_02_FULL_38_8]
MKNILNKIFYSRLFCFYFLIANSMIFLSNLIFIKHIYNNPPNFIFTLAHQELVLDYFSYLSYITLGIHGYWLKHSPYTTEATSSGMFHIFYLLLGKLASVSNIWVPYIYHLSRFISLEIYIISLYLLSYLLLGKTVAIWGGLFSLIATISPISFFKDTVNFNMYIAGIPWWINQDALRRLNAVPHHILGQALLSISIIFFILFIRHHKLVYAFFSGILILLGGLIFPPILAVYLICIPAAFILSTLRNILVNKRIFFKKFQIFGLGLIIILNLLAYLIITAQEKQGFPWNHIRLFEIEMYNFRPEFNREAVLSLGLAVFFSLPAIIVIIKHLNIDYLLVAFWALLPFILLPLANIINIPKHRILQISPYVPLGILTAYFIFKMIPKIRKNLLQFALVFIFLLINLSVSLKILTLRLQAFDFYSSGHQFHMPSKTYKALTFIEKNIPKESNFLSTMMMGNIIPAFTLMRSYVGHTDLTIQAWEKENFSKNFFSMKLSENEAEEFLKNNNIDYIYFGELEKQLGGNINDYPFLRLIFQNEVVSIYRFLKT